MIGALSITAREGVLLRDIMAQQAVLQIAQERLMSYWDFKMWTMHT